MMHRGVIGQDGHARDLLTSATLVITLSDLSAWQA
jgi:hypothetical protein